jgi:hypothetical protein
MSRRSRSSIRPRIGLSSARGGSSSSSSSSSSSRSRSFVGLGDHREGGGCLEGG